MGNLTRSRNDRLIAGVCAGIAKRLGIETFWVRLIFIIGGGVFFWIYIALAFILPYGD
ncbi:PspC domain-containing protein [Lacticaseibacillus saniviri]|uniref:Phage shock protein PspC N-terminal domain-containing protein n=1 Tax=Lacticaseibacillus saniviri JCM 17471 = DSM 24301 TaxID=1293598 RepID=A0A0R2MRD7_9LACO|nr:PspC domain-containing protein [Lacticaseibacillus saniviri]KRO16169.1 hypothetical protein IV56_GL001910 [Lacticaseibacillus saniviri JCM 17471 = DSM 24301]MCG4281279.1 PspC domain-containing protein [Lacticaseibacillus saniviri]